MHAYVISNQYWPTTNLLVTMITHSPGGRHCQLRWHLTNQVDICRFPCAIPASLLVFWKTILLPYLELSLDLFFLLYILLKGSTYFSVHINYGTTGGMCVCTMYQEHYFGIHTATTIFIIKLNMRRILYTVTSMHLVSKSVRGKRGPNQ